MKPNVGDVEAKFKELMNTLCLDMEDENLKETPKRLAKMFVNEIFCGLYEEEPEVKCFPKTQGNSLIYTKVPFNSTCAHHFQPIKGVVHIFVDYSKSDFVIGLSKFNRIVDHICKRPTLQEDITRNICNKLSTIIGTKDVVVFVKASHSCVTGRGVCAAFSDTTTVAHNSESAEFVKSCYSLLEVK